MNIRLPDYLDARTLLVPDEVAALGLSSLPAGDNRRHEHDGLVLVCDDDGMHLLKRDGTQRIVLRVEFRTGGLLSRAKVNQTRAEMLVRACGVPKDQSPWRIVDATAGLGRDAFLLAFCGAQVTMVERHPVLAMLLRAALEDLASATTDDDFHSLRAVASRLHLIESESVAALQSVQKEQRPHVVYCDPMFPPRSKSAAVGGDMQVLHALIGETPDGGELLAASLRAATRRVVVKRPLRAEALEAQGLEHIRPSYALEGRASRFDVYLIETLPL